MPETWACIDDTGYVGNCIVATAEFVAIYLPQSGFAQIIAIDDVVPRPGPGWMYDDTSETFTAPTPPPPIDPDPPVTPPFQLDEDPPSFVNPLLYELEPLT